MEADAVVFYVIVFTALAGLICYRFYSRKRNDRARRPEPSCYEHGASVKEFFKRLPQAGEDTGAFHNNRAIDLLSSQGSGGNQGILAQALVAFDQAIQRDSMNPKIRMNMAVALWGARQYASAISMLGSASTLEPENPEYYNLAGLCLFDSGRPEEAVAAYDRAIELEPGEPHANVNKANTLDYLGHPESALAIYDKVIATDPDMSMAFFNMAITLRKLGRAEAAAAFGRYEVLTQAQAETWGRRLRR